MDTTTAATAVPATSAKPRERAESTRERLIRLIESGPLITEEEAEMINRAVQEAREASIGDILA